MSNKGMSNNRVSNQRSSMIGRSSMGNNWGGMISWGRMNNRSSISWDTLNHWGIWVHSCSLIGHISNISIIAIGMVAHMLGTTIRESNRVRSSDSSCTISSFSSIKSSLGVVISNSIGVGVGRRLIRVSWFGCMVSRGDLYNWGSMDNWGSMVCWGNNRGMVCWGSMDNWGMVCWGSMVSRSSMDNWGGMVSRSMDSMSSNRNNSGMSNRDRSVSTNGRLDLRKTL